MTQSHKSKYPSPGGQNEEELRKQDFEEKNLTRSWSGP